MTFTINGYKEIADFASHSDDSRKRAEMLQLAQRLSGQPENCMALLWLYDDQKERFQLDYHEPMELGRKQSGISMPCNPADAQDPIFFATLAYPEKIRYWIRGNLRSRVDNFFPVYPRGAGGFLAIHTEQQLPEDRIAQLQALANVMAARITRHRDRRLIGVFEQISKSRMRSSGDPEATADWFNIAAAVAKHGTFAELAVAFCLEPDLSLRGIAADPPDFEASKYCANSNSLIRLTFDNRKIYRILDHADHVERLKLFGTEIYDETLTSAIEAYLGRKLRSWIAAAVVSDNEPVAVILVANKSDEYLPGVFVPQPIRNLWRIFARFFHEDLFNPKRILRYARFLTSPFDTQWRGRTPKPRRNGLLKMVQGFVPGIEAAAVSLRFRKEDAAEEFWELGELRDGALAMLRDRISPTQPIDEDQSRQIDPSFYVFEQEMRDVSHDQVAVLHILARRHGLARFEKEVLKFLSSDLGQLIRSQRAVRQQVDDLIQIRHALRGWTAGSSTHRYCLLGVQAISSWQT